jgi:hypothetical protein
MNQGLVAYTTLSRPGYGCTYRGSHICRYQIRKIKFGEEIWEAFVGV